MPQLILDLRENRKNNPEFSQINPLFTQSERPDRQPGWSGQREPPRRSAIPQHLTRNLCRLRRRFGLCRFRRDRRRLLRRFWFGVFRQQLHTLCLG